MLTFYNGGGGQFRDGLSRRSFLRAGALAVGGATDARGENPITRPRRTCSPRSTTSWASTPGRPSLTSAGDPITFSMTAT